MEEESARAAQGGQGINRRFSLQGVQLQGRHRRDRDWRRRDSVCNSFPVTATGSPSPSEEGSWARTRAKKRRRFSDLGISLCSTTNARRASPPTVIVTSSESPHSSEKDIKFLVPSQRQVEQEDSKTDDNNFLILGKTSSITAVTLDVEPVDKEREEDLLNNNAGGEDPYGSGPSSLVSSSSSCSSSSAGDGGSRCSLSTTTLSRGELRLVQPRQDDHDHDSGARTSPLSVTTTAFSTLSQNTVSVTSPPPSSEGGDESDKVIVTKTTTSSTIFWNSNNNSVSSSNSGSSHYNSNLCPENPFRKVFARRKEFYQSLASRESKVSSVNRLLLRKRHCAVCCAESRTCPAHGKKQDCANAATQSEEVPVPVPEEKKEDLSGRLTLDADIQPFLPFTIRGGGGPGSEIALGDGSAGLIRSPSSSSDLARLLQQQQPSVGGGGEGLSVDADGSLHYAASAINSEDGVESRLEVSVATDGSSVITTRRKRFGSPSEIANNSVVQVQVDEDGGKVVKIQHSLQKKTVALKQQQQPAALATSASAGSLFSGLLLPPGLLLDLAAGGGGGGSLVEGVGGGCRQRPSSAHCTQVSPAMGSNSPWMTTREQRQPPLLQQHGLQQHLFSQPRYSSLPNMEGRRRPLAPPIISAFDGDGFPLIENVGLMEEQQQQQQFGASYTTHPADEEKRLAFTRGRKDGFAVCGGLLFPDPSSFQLMLHTDLSSNCRTNALLTKRRFHYIKRGERPLDQDDQMDLQLVQ